MSVADAMTEFIGALHAHLYSASMTGRQKMTNNPKRGGKTATRAASDFERQAKRTVTWCAKVIARRSSRDKASGRIGGGAG